MCLKKDWIAECILLVVLFICGCIWLAVHIYSINPTAVNKIFNPATLNKTE
jgi:hypothetical protein